MLVSTLSLAGVVPSASAATLLDTVDIGSSMFGIAIAPDRSEIWVTTGADEVAIVDPETNTVIDRIGVEVRPRGLTFSPDGTRVYVLSTFTNTAVPDAIVQAYSVDTRTAVGP
ncbi:MAG: hypothetical protein Q7J04_05025, partial [Microcella sp.]|nr:hypothetical protein [Microcella sp.]